MLENCDENFNDWNFGNDGTGVNIDGTREVAYKRTQIDLRKVIYNFTQIRNMIYSGKIFLSPTRLNKSLIMSVIILPSQVSSSSLLIRVCRRDT